MKSIRDLCVAAVLLMSFAHGTAWGQAREESKVILATQVMEELRAQRDQYIPDLLLERAYGIAVIPDVVKVGLGIGGRRGTGVLLVRDKAGRFSQPVFVALTGGSIGWQVGAQKTDVVLVFTTRSGIDGITDGKLTLGADAAVAAGPVGRSASAATDQSFNAEIYSYSRARGLFAGVALDGSVISIERKSNGRFYGARNTTANDIINGAVSKNNESVRRLLGAVAVSTRPTNNSRDTEPAPQTTAVEAEPAATASGAEPEGAKTFPLEDKNPGQEPPR
jgi:lipid-binding SYLF domain-containing protein